MPLRSVIVDTSALYALVEADILTIRKRRGTCVNSVAVCPYWLPSRLC